MKKVYMCVYIYIYIEREREKRWDREVDQKYGTDGSSSLMQKRMSFASDLICSDPVRFHQIQLSPFIVKGLKLFFQLPTRVAQSFAFIYMGLGCLHFRWARSIDYYVLIWGSCIVDVVDLVTWRRCMLNELLFNDRNRW